MGLSSYKMALILLNNFSWELLNATEPLAIRQKTEYISAELIDQAAANGIYKLVPLDSKTQSL